MKQEEMNRLVPLKLKEIEEQYHAEVLWAVESGSRAWGFASPDSDFDVRFIYKRKPEDYLRPNPDRDVIEMPVDDTWDVSGWDLDKTLKLLNKSNPTLYEWMNSPICYIQSDFKARLEPLLEVCFSEKNMLHHYVNTAGNDYRAYLQSDTVIPKKYFYALRPVLACRWIMEYHSAPPVLFDDLRRAVMPSCLDSPVDRLLDLKIHGPEKMRIEPIGELDHFLLEEIETIRQYIRSIQEEPVSRWDRLNAFFLEEISR